MSSQIKLILLDFDGTLADTARANCLAYMRTLGEAGYELAEKEYMEKYFGMRCTEFMHSVGFTDNETIKQIRRRKAEIYPEYFDTVKLNGPLWDMCTAFRAAGGKVWIVSTGNKDNITNAMHHLGIEGGTDGIITGADVVHGKPDPECFLKAMDAEGVSPEETLIFEDSQMGIEAASRSGANYIVIKL